MLKLLQTIRDKFTHSEWFTLGLLALAIGLTSGAGVWLFKVLVELVREFFFSIVPRAFPESAGKVLLVLAPVVGGLVVGLLLTRTIHKEKLHGVAGIMESVALGGGRLPAGLLPAKIAAASVSIGSGASVGPEDPSVQIGTHISSYLGQRLHLSEDRMRSVVAAGAASAIAAAFNAPIAGVFFAMEVILGEISSGPLGLIVLAAVVSSSFTQAVSGAQPAFRVPPYPAQSPWELPLYLVLGILAGLVAVAYIALLFQARDRFDALKIPLWLKPALGGLLVGLVGAFLPQVFGVGYETIDLILSGENLSLWLLLALLAAKLVLTPVSIGSGFQGGVFAPSLFLGANLGAGFASMARVLFPGLAIFPQAFAMVGMAAVLAGAVHAPLTAIMLLFEMTNDYRIILPLMAAVVVSMIVSRQVQRDSVYTYSLTRRGIRLDRGRDIEVLQGITVGEVMETEPPLLVENQGLQAADELMTRLNRQGMPVVDSRGELCGILTITDLRRAQIMENGEDAPVGSACTRRLITVFPDDRLDQALQTMGVQDIGRLPVVSRENPCKLVGLLRRSDVIRAYETALVRRAAVRHRMEGSRLGVFTGLAVEEVVVESGASVVDNPMRDIYWPVNCLVASIQRGRRLVIPHGETTLKAGDTLVVVGSEPDLIAVRRLCAAVGRADA